MHKRRTNPSDSKKYFEWMANAKEDITVAGILVKESDCRKSCAFHCQQAIEKALKAYMLIVTGRLLDGHNLTWLCKQALKHDNEFKQWLDESASLNHYYIETRYPPDIPLKIDENRINYIYSMALAMYNFIDDQVDEEEELILDINTNFVENLESEK